MKNISALKSIKNYFHKIKNKLLIFFFLKIYGRVYFNLNIKKNLFIKKITLNNSKYAVYKIYNGRLYTDRIVNVAYIKDNNLINGPSIQLENFTQSKIANNVVLKSGTPRIIKNVKGRVLSILIGASGNKNYWHWLFEVLPKIFLYEKFYSINKLDRIIVPSLKENFQSQTLLALKIKSEKIIDSNFYRHIKTKELIATSNIMKFSVNNKIPQWVISELKIRFLKNINAIKNFDRIYIDRSDSGLNVNYRKIINEKEIKNFLISKNFKMVRLSDFSFSDQVSMFNNAKFIVGLHGAGFANVVFCKKNTKILEIKPKKAGNIIKNLSRANNLRYFNINLAPLDKPTERQFGLLYLPINKLKMYI